MERLTGETGNQVQIVPLGGSYLLVHKNEELHSLSVVTPGSEISPRVIEIITSDATVRPRLTDCLTARLQAVICRKGEGGSLMEHALRGTINDLNQLANGITPRKLEFEY